MARLYLTAKGYNLIEKNFSRKGGEIDLIFFSPDKMIVFVEVKTQKNSSPFSIYASLTKRKKKRLLVIINKWLLSKSLVSWPWRVDFVGIVYGKITSIEHFEFVSLY